MLFSACNASTTPERLFVGKSIWVTSPVITHFECGPMRVRSMNPADWPAIRAIYEEGIATGDAVDAVLDLARRLLESE